MPNSSSALPSESATDSSHFLGHPADSNVPHESLRLPVPRGRGAAATATSHDTAREPSVADLGAAIERGEKAKQQPAPSAFQAPSLQVSFPTAAPVALSLSGQAPEGSPSSTAPSSFNFSTLIDVAGKSSGKPQPVAGLVASKISGSEALGGLSKFGGFGINVGGGSGGGTGSGNGNGNGSGGAPGAGTSNGSTGSGASSGGK